MGVKKLRLKTAGPCFGDHIIPYYKAKMLYLSNLEKKILSNGRGIKVAFFRVQRPDYIYGTAIPTSSRTIGYRSSYGSRLSPEMHNHNFHGCIVLSNILSQLDISLSSRGKFTEVVTQTFSCNVS